MSELLIFAHFPFFGEQCERFAHDRSFPLSNVSESLILLTLLRGNERMSEPSHFFERSFSIISKVKQLLRISFVIFLFFRQWALGRS